MLFAHPQYRIIRRDRSKGAGGLLVYIRSAITAYRQVKLEPEGIESICIDVKGYGNNWFMVCACYRSPGKCKITEFIPACMLAAERMYAKRKEILFIGDFNMDMLSRKDNPQGPSQELSGFCDQICLTNVIRNPTRVTNSSKSLLDVILVSHPERYETSGNLHLGISDHDLVYTVKKLRLPKPKARTIEFRSLKNLDNEAFISDLKSIPWDSSYTFDNVDDVWAHWEKLYKQVLDKHAPVQQIRLRDNQLPWINPSIQKQIRLRNRLSKKFRRAPTDTNWINYKNQRNIVTAIKRKAVKEFCLDAASCSSKSSIGSFWKKIEAFIAEQ